LKTNFVSRLAHSVAIDDNLYEDSIIFEIFSCFDVIVSDKFRSSKTGILFHSGSPQERLVLRAGVGFDAELDVFAFVRIVVLVKQEEGYSVIEWPF
jgi:hypothetical protein